MTEINIPVLVLDDTCRTCEELDIVKDKTKLYSGDECVSCEILARCVHILRCANIQKRILRNAEAKSERTTD